MSNQNPEQEARDAIDRMLTQAGWVVQSKSRVDLSAGQGVAVREYPTDIGPADYVLFVERKPVGVVEAKREEEGRRMTVHEDQAEDYAAATLKHLDNERLPFVYESTGTVTRFTDGRDPKPRSRTVFAFHRPATLAAYVMRVDPAAGLPGTPALRARLQNLPPLDETGLRPAQIHAIRNLEASFKKNRPKALIQMATGAGKTYTACSFVYRLLKHAGAHRILFLVDTRNLGEQAEQEFMAYRPPDDNRKFTELYNVQRLSSGYIASDSQVCISTIQRLYAILQGKDLDETAEESLPGETDWKKKPPAPVVYSPENPIEQFDFIIIDECHRSIYNLWKQVLDYYDAFLIGLTATPDKRTFGFFNQNVVSEYPYEQSVIDGVNVPYDVFTIETEITRDGAKLKAREFVDKREKLSRRKRWDQLDEDLDYTPNQLDKDIVNLSQIRSVVRAFKESLPAIFPDRHEADGSFEVPKTLVFAKSDSHADDIIQIIREEFGEGNDFCKKLTYKTDEDPKSVLNRFRNAWAPRIAVTVDMIATGTDVKPLEVLLFMRDVRSKNYFEQMKGRGTRTLAFDDLQRVSRTVKHTKTHFVIIDAVGAVKSKKTDSRPLERKRSVPLKELLDAVAIGARDEDLFTSLANRLIRLEKQLTDQEKDGFHQRSGGQTLRGTAARLLEAHDPDAVETRAQTLIDAKPKYEQSPGFREDCHRQAQDELATEAARPFTGELNEYIEQVRKVHEQIIDTVNLDHLIRADWDTASNDNARAVVEEFSRYIETHKDEITALGFFYDQPYQRRSLSFRMIKELLETLKTDKPLLAPHYVWEAYARLENVNAASPKNELVALVSLIRRVCGMDTRLTPFHETVDKNFKDWVFKKHSGAGEKFTDAQMDWLRLLKDHIATSFQVKPDDLDYTPFDAQGGRGRMQQLFGDRMTSIMNELNEGLVA